MVSTNCITCIPDFDQYSTTELRILLKHQNGIQLTRTFLIGCRRELLPALREGLYNVPHLLTVIVLSRNQLTTRLGGRRKQ